MASRMSWDSETDAKLFAAVLTMFDLKFSKEMIIQLNEVMGLDAKSTAVSHRLRDIRKKAGTANNSPSKKATPAKTRRKRGNTDNTEDRPSDNEETKPKKRARGRSNKPSTAQDIGEHEDESEQYGVEPVAEAKEETGDLDRSEIELLFGNDIRET